MSSLRFFAFVIALVIGFPWAAVPAKAASLSYLDIQFGTPTATLPLDRYLHHVFPIKNTDSKAHTVNFGIRVKDTNQEVVGWPQPQVLYFEPGETLYVKTFLDENWGKIDKTQYGDHTRTVEWTFDESGTKRKETVTYKYSVKKDSDVSGDQTYIGKVVDSKGKAVSSAMVSLSTGNFTKTTTAGNDGTFTFANMPQRNDWMLKASKSSGTTQSAPAGNGGVPNQPGGGQPAQPSGQQCDPPPAPCNPPSGNLVPAQPGAFRFAQSAYAATTSSETGYAFIEAGKTSYTITLQSTSLEADYAVSATVKNKIGYWKGDVDDAEQLVLVANGMENWQDTNRKDDSQLELYTIDGEKKWSYAMGWEAWGVDLSKDGKYAAYTTSNSTKNLGVVDATTGKAIWKKSGKEFASGATLTAAGEGGGIDSKEVTISNTNKYLGVGHGGGNVFLAELLTGKVLWSKDIKGQVRGIVFDATDEHMYAGSGDGNAYKLKTSDGSVVWKTSIGSWPFTNGFKLSTDGKYLGAASKFGEVTVIDTATGKQLWQADQLGNASLLSFSPDSKYVYAGGGGSGASTLYETTTGKKIWRLDRFAHQGMFSGDGKFIMVGDQDVAFYDLAGNLVGSVTAESNGSGGGQGQFAYITKDATKFVYSRRDMTGEGTALVFAKGKMAQSTAVTTDDSKTTKVTAQEAGTRQEGSSMPWLKGLLIVLGVGCFVGVSAFIVGRHKHVHF